MFPVFSCQLAASLLMKRLIFPFIIAMCTSDTETGAPAVDTYQSGGSGYKFVSIFPMCRLISSQKKCLFVVDNKSLRLRRGSW